MARLLPILTFHALDDERSVLSVPPRVFNRGVARLRELGYRSIRLAEATECVRRGAPFPDRSFVVTFDDGFRSVYEEAFPVLERYGVTATVFLAVGAGPEGALHSIDAREMLTWNQVRELQRNGVEFGAHTMTHPDLTRLPTSRIEAEIEGSKAVLEDVIGVEVASFAYPFGRSDRRCREIARRLFDCACTSRLGLVGRSSDPYQLERVDAYYLRTDRLFRLLSSRMLPWYVRARAIPRRLRAAAQELP